MFESVIPSNIEITSGLPLPPRLKLLGYNKSEAEKNELSRLEKIEKEKDELATKIWKEKRKQKGEKSDCQVSLPQGVGKNPIFKINILNAAVDNGWIKRFFDHSIKKIAAETYPDNNKR